MQSQTNAKFLDTLVSTTGTWGLTSVGTVVNSSSNEEHWGIALKSKKVHLRSVGLSKNKSPHGLVYTIGDPDSGDAIFLERK